MLKTILALSLITNTCLADCIAVTKACDKAIADQQTLVKQMQVQIGNYQQKSTLDEQIKSDQQKELNEWYRDPVKVTAVSVVAIVILELATGVLHK